MDLEKTSEFAYDCFFITTLPLSTSRSLGRAYFLDNMMVVYAQQHNYISDWNDLSQNEKIERVMSLFAQYIPDDTQRLQVVSALNDRQLQEYSQGDVMAHLESGLFRIDDILPISGEILYEITSAPHCIAALENHEITLEALVEMGADDIYETYYAAFVPQNN